MDLVERMSCGPRPLLWDGGVGTALISRGLELSREPPEFWLQSHPDEVRAVHAEFAAAGADVVQTNSFGLLRLMLSAASAHGHAHAHAHDYDWQALARTSVALAQAGARARAGAPARVVASLGPTGGARALAAQSGDEERLIAAAAQLAAWFQDAGAEALHLETCYDPAELRATLNGVRSGAPQLPILVSLTVNIGQTGLETPLGVPMARLLRELQGILPAAVGVNCSLHARRMRKAVAELHAFTELHRRSGVRLPILAQPQVDQPAPDCKRRSQLETPEQFARDLLGLLDVSSDAGPDAVAAGANALGGCCGCRQIHIAAARAAIDCAF